MRSKATDSSAHIICSQNDMEQRLIAGSLAGATAASITHPIGMSWIFSLQFGGYVVLCLDSFEEWSVGYQGTFPYFCSAVKMFEMWFESSLQRTIRAR